MKSEKVQNMRMDLVERLNKSFLNTVTAKGKRNFRLCVIIRFGISDDTYHRLLHSEKFTYSQLQILSQILGCTFGELVDSRFLFNPEKMNLSIPEWVSEIEVKK